MAQSKVLIFFASCDIYFCHWGLIRCKFHSVLSSSDSLAYLIEIEMIHGPFNLEMRRRRIRRCGNCLAMRVSTNRKQKISRKYGILFEFRNKLCFIACYAINSSIFRIEFVFN